MRKLFITLLMLGLSVGLIANVHAEDYSLKEITPQVKSALDARKARFEQLNDLKTKGILGENNLGYVTALAVNNAASKVADEENQNRKVIYKAIAEQNGLKDKVDIIEKVFARIKRDSANSGEMIQLETGDWIVKK